MEIETATKSLHELLKDDSWFTAIGVGDNTIFVYVKVAPESLSREIPSEWEGFPIIVRRMDTPRPAVVEEVAEVRGSL